jgi:uncharacterized Zn-finger protein
MDGSMTHTIDTILALADRYRDLKVGEGTAQARAALHVALVEALDHPEQRLDMVAQPVREQTQANNDEVICPSCCTQFRAIPVSVQKLMLDAGFEPPFVAQPVREPLLSSEIDAIYESIPEYAQDGGWMITFARAIERAHGIGS